MIDFYYWPTPNGWKVSIMLEELEIPCQVIPVNIREGEQFRPEYLAISPNHRMPAIIDHDAEGAPVPVFESGAILWYLANKYQRLMPQDPVLQKEVMEWMFWQVGGLGPMAGQHSHFWNYAPQQERYSAQRYADEYNRCIGVVERRLAGREYLVGEEYTIADIICWPWILIAKAMGQSLDEFPNVSRWRNLIKQRPAVQRGVDLGKEYRRNGPPTDSERQILFNQTAKTAEFKAGKVEPVPK